MYSLSIWTVSATCWSTQLSVQPQHQAGHQGELRQVLQGQLRRGQVMQERHCFRARKPAFPCGAAVFQHLVKLFLGTASQHESSVFLHPFIACSAPASAFCLPALFLLLIICHGTHRDNYSPRRQAPELPPPPPPCCTAVTASPAPS